MVFPAGDDTRSGCEGDLSPQVRGYSVEQNLKPKVKWLSDLGMTREQVAKVMVVFPGILGLSLDKNLGQKRALLQEVLVCWMLC